MKNALKHVLGFRRCLSLEQMTLERKDATGKDVNVIVKQVQQLMVLATSRVTEATVCIDMIHGVTISITVFLLPDFGFHSSDISLYYSIYFCVRWLNRYR